MGEDGRESIASDSEGLAGASMKLWLLLIDMTTWLSDSPGGGL